MRNSFFGILLVLLVLTACEKPESNIGLELLPEEEYLGLSIDSTTVLLRTTFHDSLKTSRWSSMLLGDFDDPGLNSTVSSTLFTQFVLSSQNVDFTDTAILDSLVLTLAYNDYKYGFNDPEEVSITVERLIEPMYYDSVYYSYNSIESDGVDLVAPESKYFIPDNTADVVVGNDTLDPHIRIKFDTDMTNLGAEFLNPEYRDSLANNTLFLSYFRGLKISMEKQSGNGGIYSFNLVSNLSKMTLYYHLPDIDSLSFDFRITDQCQQFTHFEHEYDEASLEMNIPNPERVYLQSMGGLGIEVTLPTIHDFADDENILINRAILELPVEDFDIEQYPPCASVRAFMTEEGIDVPLPDALLSGLGTNYNLGTYDEEKKVHRIVVTRFVQRVINGQIDNPVMTIIPTINSTVANRSIIKVGDLGENRRAKLIINYTTF